VFRGREKLNAGKLPARQPSPVCFLFLGDSADLLLVVIPLVSARGVSLLSAVYARASATSSIPRDNEPRVICGRSL